MKDIEDRASGEVVILFQDVEVGKIYKSISNAFAICQTVPTENV